MSIATERAALFAQGLELVTRERWGAVQSYASTRSVVTPAKWLFLHVSVTDRTRDPAADMRTIERVGQSRFGIGCSYNAAATQDGRLWEMQPLCRRGAHTVNDLVNPNFPEGSLNYLARALVLPQQVSDAVTDAQIDAAARWGAALCRAGLAVRGAPWFGHRDVTQKGCPGDAGYRRLGELNRLTRYYEANGLEDDMAAADVDRIISAINERTGLVVNTVNARTGMIYNAVKGLTPDAFADAVVAKIPPGGDLSAEQIKQAVREVFADAGAE